MTQARSAPPPSTPRPGWGVPPSDTSGGLPPGTRVDHFVILRLVGRGGMGEVYLARDEQLGRRVALKLIHQNVRDTSKVRDQFFVEARATARCNHPHIVTIYAVGEHQGRPYLALEFLTGESLRQRVRDRRLSEAETTRLGAAIAEALAAAHEVGVMHRDLKPDNVIIGNDGRLRVLDFGLATFSATPNPAVLAGEHDTVPMRRTTHGGGTPEYMAPEQWIGLPPSEAIDVWALGVILYEMCTGGLPFDLVSFDEMAKAVTATEPAPRADAVADLSKPLADLIADCLHKSPGKRPDASELVLRLHALLRPQAAIVQDEQSPFRGLLPFDAEHAHLFFGREPEIDALIERMRTAPVLPVVGPSGVGKSSFVRAGVIPRLCEQGQWLVLSLRVGAQPLMSLARVLLGDSPADLRADQEATAELAARLREAPQSLSLLLQMVLKDTSAERVLLFVDQLEELFTHCDDSEAQAKLMLALCSAAQDTTDPVRVLFTLRDDFLGRAITGPEVSQALSQVFVLPRLDAERLQQTLRLPLDRIGYRFEEPQVMADMVAEVQGAPTGLPLLQFAARQLWEERDAARRVLPAAAYRRIGGVAGALAKHADGVLDSMTREEQGVAARLLLRLVNPDKTRRVVPRSQLLEGNRPAAERVVAKLEEARLLAISGGADAARATDPPMELTHEALIVSWERLSRWIDESHDQLALLGELRQAAELWKRHGRHRDRLWHDTALPEARRTLERAGPAASKLIRDYIDASAERAASVQRRKRLLVGGALVGLLVVAVVLGFQKREADRQRAIAEQRERQAQQLHAEALKEAALAAYGQGSVLEARAKLRRALEVGTQAGAGERALWWALRNERLAWVKRLGSSAFMTAFSPTEDMLATAAQSGDIFLIDAVTRHTRILHGSQDQMSAVAFSRDGSMLASADFAGTVSLWEVRTGERLWSSQAHQGEIFGLAFGPDDQLASAGSDQHIRIWSAQDGKVTRSIAAHNERIFGLAYRPDGKLLASASRDGSIRLWDPHAGAHVGQLSGHRGGTYYLAFDPSGERLASAGADRTVTLWDVSTERALHHLKGHSDRVISVAFSPDGQRLASGGFDNRVHIWRATDGRLELQLRGHTGNIRSVAFSRDGSQLASASFDGTVRMWSLADVSPRPADIGHIGGLRGVAFTPDGKLIATGGSDRTVRLWQADSGAPQAILRGHSDGVRGVAFSPDGTWLASASVDKTVRIWDVASGAERHALSHPAGVRAVVFSPDGSTIASASFDGVIRLWDPLAGEPRGRLRGHNGAVFEVAFHPDGKQLVSAGRDRQLRLWTLDGEQLPVLGEQSATIYGVAFAPDGSQVVSVSESGEIAFWPFGESGDEARAPLRHDGRLYDIAWSPNGSLAFGGSPAQPAISHNGERLQLHGHRGEVTALTFDPDGDTLATVSDGGTLRLWNATSGAARWRAPALLASPARLFTHRGWQQLDPHTDASKNTNQATSNDPNPPPSEDLLTPTLRTLIETRARYATSAGSNLCILLDDGTLQLHAPNGKRHATLDHIRHVTGHPRGCLAYGSAAWWLSAGAPPQKLPIEGTPIAIGLNNDHLAIASEHQIKIFDARSSTLTAGQTRAHTNISAVGLAHGELVAGEVGGHIHLIPLSPSQREPIPLDQLPSATPLLIRQGPAHTLAIGYANGIIGLWDIRSGRRLLQARLHGPITHLLIEGTMLYAVGELGHHLSWDLSIFGQDHCTLLREVWRHVPVTWTGGSAQRQPPPPAHRCH